MRDVCGCVGLIIVSVSVTGLVVVIAINIVINIVIRPVIGID